MSAEPNDTTDTVVVGRIGRPHGVRGEVTVEVRTDDLQGDLTTVLGWAADRGVRLTDLRAAPASLADRLTVTALV